MPLLNVCRSLSPAHPPPLSVYLPLPLFCSLSPSSNTAHPLLLSSFTLPSHPLPLPQRLDVLTSIYSMSPPEGGVWDHISGATDVLTCVHMPDGLTVQVPVRRDQTAADLLSAACKVGLAASCGEMMTPQQLWHIPDSCCRKTKQNQHCLVEFYIIQPFILNLHFPVM